jgi:hypothetical protein
MIFVLLVGWVTVASVYRLGKRRKTQQRADQATLEMT